MRFEDKHNYFAQLANHTRNFRNICYSLAMRHQQYSSHMFKNMNLHDGFEMDNIIEVKLSELDDSYDIIEVLRLIKSFESCSTDILVYSTNQIKYKGYMYKLNYVVCFDMWPVFPKFGIISDFIAQSEKKCLLVVKEMTVEYFDRHFFAYKVLTGENIVLVDVENLIIHDCMEVQRNCKVEGLFISLRRHL